MSYFEMPNQWCIPDAALACSMKEMAIDGALGNEGVAMWLGKYEESRAIVSHVALLRGRGVSKAPAQLLIGADLVNDIADKAIELGLVLIGQIHSHGPMHGTSLSMTDKKYGISVPGYISVVAPDYALRASTRISDCGVHVFETGRGWVRLTGQEVADKILVAIGIQVSVFHVGSIQE